MAILNLDHYALDGSVFSCKNNVLSCEVSDLRNNKGYGGLAEKQIYDDACDIGIAVKSPRTGRIVYFYLSHTDTDREGEACAWRYKPISEHVRKFHLPANMEVIIFND